MTNWDRWLEGLVNSLVREMRKVPEQGLLGGSLEIKLLEGNANSNGGGWVHKGLLPSSWFGFFISLFL